MTATPLKWTAVILLCFILQTTLMPVIAIAGISPDLLIIVLVFLSIKTGVMPGIYVGFFIGLGQDLYSPAILGQSALAKTVTGFFAGLFNERMMRSDPIVKMIVLALGILLHDLIFTTAMVVKNGDSPGILLTEILIRTLPRIVYSVMVTALFYLWEQFIKPLFTR